ncbi:FtsX-like permease family protein [Pseudobutyrivibrio sp. MD2005]|uniref:FtsX-like permease family protein n=1 Tax=Pseudobutyrivibrio sp. MD2005 TaxID=1410616 RepID=UPI0004873103|nr:ABC transporter permease [Pseudobutyrivibrio sp. MD2005]
MLGILKNSLLKDIYKNRTTYLLMVLFISVGMYVAATLASITYSYNIVCNANYITSNYQDGQFSLRAPLKEKTEISLEKNGGVTLERIFSFDLKIDNDSILRIFKLRKNIDLVVLDKGVYPKKNNEVVLDKCFAANHNLLVGDVISINSKEYFITGLGSVTDYDEPDRNISDYGSNSLVFGLAFLTDEAYASLLSEAGMATRQEYVYSYKLEKGATDENLRLELMALLESDDMVMTFIPRNNNGRMCSAVEDGFAYEICGFAVGIGLLFLVSVIFYLNIKKTIEKESSSIGALYAMGVKKIEVIFMYLAPPTLVSFVAGLLGWLGSVCFSATELVSNSNYYCVPYVPLKTSPFIFVYCVLMPPTSCFLINVIILNKSFSKPPVILLKGTMDINEKCYKGHDNKGIMFNLICSRISKDFGLFIVLFIGSLVAGIIYMLGCGLGQFVGNIQNRLPQEIRYKYVYDLLDETYEPLNNGEAVYKKTFKYDNLGYVLDIEFLGIESSSEYFDVSTDNLNGRIIISKAIANRYGLQKDDSLTVYDGVTGKKYIFIIAGIADYKVMYTAFMDIDDLRNLLGRGNVYNSIYSDVVCNYSPRELLGSYSREDYLNPIDSFAEEAGSMKVFFIVVSVFFFAAMIIYIVRFSINGATRHIAIYSVLGYSNVELQIVFLSSTALYSIVCGVMGLIIGFEFSKIAVPYLLATTPIGIFLTYSIKRFIRDILIIILIYLIAVVVSFKQIKDIDELQYIRARE